MAVDLTICRLEQGPLLARTTCRDVGRLYDPDAHSLVAARIHITCILDSHFGVGSMQTSRVLMRQTVLASNEYFPKQPIVHICFGATRPPCVWPAFLRMQRRRRAPTCPLHGRGCESASGRDCRDRYLESPCKTLPNRSCRNRSARAPDSTSNPDPEFLVPGIRPAAQFGLQTSVGVRRWRTA